jgi:hypothetical protein
MAGTWKLLKNVAWSSGNTIDSGTFDGQEFVKVMSYTSGANIEPLLRLNSDSSSNQYTTRRSNDGSGSNQTNATFFKANATGGDTANSVFTTATIKGISTERKLAIINQVAVDETGVASGDEPRRAYSAGVWFNSSDKITSVQIYNNSTGSFTSGDFISVWGASSDTVTDEKTTLTNVPDNTRYEEYNTRKIFRSLSLKTGCKAYYKFDSTSGGLTNQATSANGFADGLGSNVDGTVTGATTSTDKKLGTHSYLFDGNDYVVCGSTSDFNFAHKTGHTVTIAFWFKQSNAPSGGEIIVGTASTSVGSSTGFYLGTHTSGRIFFSLYDGDATTEPINDYLTGNNVVPDTSNWYHYVFTFDDSNLTIYRNGSQVATTAYTASSTSTGNATNPLTLGKAPNASGNYLDGRLDDMGIWDRILSTSEISELYNSGTGKTVNTAMIWIERNTAT